MSLYATAEVCVCICECCWFANNACTAEEWSGVERVPPGCEAQFWRAGCGPPFGCLCMSVESWMGNVRESHLQLFDIKMLLGYISGSVSIIDITNPDYRCRLWGLFCTLLSNGQAAPIAVDTNSSGWVARFECWICVLALIQITSGSLPGV